jgi:hypothetical protein
MEIHVMRIGVPKEVKVHEYRVGMTPAQIIDRFAARASAAARARRRTPGLIRRNAVGDLNSANLSGLAGMSGSVVVP